MNKRITVRVTPAQHEAIRLAMEHDRAMSRKNTDHATVTRDGWRRYCRRHGVAWPAETDDVD